ncbi:oxidoreductase family protein [Ophiostoma piceae UAMH 11346]|uniref:Oxidoreductase family protein n=1 Tax=Ophiostoma piceae (strain UAMH 11346) TaxID=1262450 RepID=S3BVC7_OPHP1|nr:oxidoreductase family protein [Ophiostoma piceae UAMH 11346]
MATKVAIVGLSARGATGWGSNAHLPYLLSERGRQNFTIVALLNSSDSAARGAIAQFELAATVKPYGDAQTFADDVLAKKIDVDLVVVSTRVDVHYPAIQPLLKTAANAGKKADGLKVLVEWPLTSNVDDARELTGLAASAGIKTAVALQGRFAPWYRAIRDVILAGKIGRVLSSEASGYGGSLSRTSIPEALAYFVDRSFGGNLHTIGLGHLIDTIQATIGELDPARTTALTQLQRPDVHVRRATADGSSETVEIKKANVPDLIAVLGRLSPLAVPGAKAPSPYLDGSATLSVRLRRGEPFLGQPAYVWTINGEKGEIRLVAESGPSTQAFGGGNNNTGPSAINVEVHDFETNKVTTVPWEWQDWQSALTSVPARNIGSVYEALLAHGDADPAHEHATFADALARQEQLESYLKDFEE